MREAWPGARAVRAGKLGIRGDFLKLRVEGNWLRRGSLHREIPEGEEELFTLLTNDFELGERVALGVMEKLKE